MRVFWKKRLMVLPLIIAIMALSFNGVVFADDPSSSSALTGTTEAVASSEVEEPGSEDAAGSESDGETLELGAEDLDIDWGDTDIFYVSFEERLEPLPVKEAESVEAESVEAGSGEAGTQAADNNDKTTIIVIIVVVVIVLAAVVVAVVCVTKRKKNK